MGYYKITKLKIGTDFLASKIKKYFQFALKMGMFEKSPNLRQINSSAKNISRCRIIADFLAQKKLNHLENVRTFFFAPKIHKKMGNFLTHENF